MEVDKGPFVSLRYALYMAVSINLIKAPLKGFGVDIRQVLS